MARTPASPKTAAAKSRAEPVVRASARQAAAPIPAAAGHEPAAPAPLPTDVAVTAENAVESVIEPVNQAVAAAPVAAAPEPKEPTVDTNTVTAKGEAMFADMNERAKGAMSKGSRMFAELNEFNKGNVEALVESGKIAVKGIESMGQDAAEYGRKSFETASSALKGMAQVKSPTELVKLQSEYVRGAFDMFVAETSRSTEMMLKLAGEVAQPISNRLAVAADKVKLAA